MYFSNKIDPTIDLSSNQIISIIVEFSTQPAKTAVLEAKAKGITLTLEEAERQVEQSHQEFRKLLTVLDQNHVPYRIRYTYKTAFNGVSMELPANEIKRLVKAPVIARIHPNKQIQLDPPIKPSY